MLRWWILACLAVALTFRPAAAQPYPPGGGPPGYPGVSPYGGNGEALVASWYQRFLGRPMDEGAGGWIDSLNGGQRPNTVLAGILGSQEYFRRAGGTPPDFITALYQDLTGSPPQPQQLNYWLSRMRFEPRRDVAYHLLMFYAHSWQTPRPASYSYRPSMHYPHYPYYSRLP